jgi:hypothetical protein
MNVDSMIPQVNIKPIEPTITPVEDQTDPLSL